MCVYIYIYLYIYTCVCIKCFAKTDSSVFNHFQKSCFFIVDSINLNQTAFLTKNNLKRNKATNTIKHNKNMIR